MAMAIPKQTHVGRILSYELYRMGERGPVFIVPGTMAIDSVYDTPERSAIALLDYIKETALDDAMKNPGFVEDHGTNPEDFFVVITLEFKA